ncbi:unnamed protein product [Eruca vesicaria subsp. sativa]|uniref:Acid phosphatase n=1 Tax=Eruca vesicaria subsp. sativa TaxID=29727 RepID=A0ABC8J426_ERUVS|nr:unnamed protein product [Eruca vesicaria subsp. sativa]
MACYRSSSLSFFIVALLTVLISPAISAGDSSYINPPVNVGSRSSIASYCESWRLAVETNNAGTWNVTPSKCVSSINTYYIGGQFDSDYNLVARYALAFAGKVKNRLDGKDAWVFDIDETLLSNSEYYNKAHGSATYVSKKVQAQAFDASLKLYKGLKTLNFTIILLTGRNESRRSTTEKNLWDVGYSGWEHLLMRSPEDKGKTATQYKSEQRSKMVKKGYKLHGNTGDQWSDLLGFAVATRSFKVPNPLYYIA